ncbi:hypothetical protein HAX54_026770 [Datura stramonium]|uniref:Uncharacterized protein n=1 Tax=Datura stramonium TaxID=4076 RepID=A0ABS8V3J3_DATST|nr:hypothetical protein [Datura stramonium]
MGCNTAGRAQMASCRPSSTSPGVRHRHKRHKVWRDMQEEQRSSRHDARISWRIQGRLSQQFSAVQHRDAEQVYRRKNFKGKHEISSLEEHLKGLDLNISAYFQKSRTAPLKISKQTLSKLIYSSKSSNFFHPNHKGVDMKKQMNPRV